MRKFSKLALSNPLSVIMIGWDLDKWVINYILKINILSLKECHNSKLRWVFWIRLQLSGILHINNGVIFKNSHRCQILLPFLFLRIFVLKFDKCCPNSHWGLCDLFINLAKTGKMLSKVTYKLSNGHKRSIFTSVYHEIPNFSGPRMVSQLWNCMQIISNGQIMLCRKNSVIVQSNAPCTFWGSGITPMTPSGGHASLGTTQQSQRLTLNWSYQLLRNRETSKFYIKWTRFRGVTFNQYNWADIFNHYINGELTLGLQPLFYKYVHQLNRVNNLVIKTLILWKSNSASELPLSKDD